MAESIRVCSKCGVAKPLSVFPCGKFRCRACINARLRANRHAKAPTVICIQCGKSFTRYYARQSLCSDHCKAARRRSLLGQPEPTRIPCGWCGAEFMQLRSYSRFCSIRCHEADRHQRRSKDPKYRKQHAEYRRKWEAANSAHIREIKRARRHEFPEVARAKVQHYRAMKLLATTVPFTAEQVRLKVEYWGGKCWMCGAPGTDLDHVKPLSKQGPHMLANLRPACKSCNSSKNGNWYGPAHLDRFFRADPLP